MRTHKNLLIPITIVFFAYLLTACWHLNRPFLGNFATKAVMYGMITENAGFGWSLADWLPTIRVLINGKPGLHLVEWPWPCWILAGSGLLKLFSMETVGKGMTLLMVFPSSFFLYKLVRLMGAPRESAIGSVFALLLCPIAFLYFVSYQMDMYALVCLVASGFYAVKMRSEQFSKFDPINFILFFTLTLLLKPHWIVYALPFSVIYIRQSLNRKIFIALIMIISTLLPAAWIVFNFHLSSTDAPLFFSLAKNVSHQTSRLSYLMNYDFWIRFLKNVAVLVPGLPLLFYAFKGLLDRAKSGMNETDLFMLAWTTASIIQLILLPGKFFEANYYYIPALIPVFYYAGLGLPIRGRTFYISGAILFCALALLFPVKVLYFVPDAEKTVSAAGSAVYSLTGAHDKVVAESGDSPALLYYTHRSGWVYSAVSKDEQHHFFEDAINYGATMFATTNPGKWKTGEASDLIGDYAEILTSSDDFSIYRFRSAAHD